MSYVLGMLVSAAILGDIVTVREGEFPGWGPMCGIALAAGGPRGLVGVFIPTPFDLLGTAVGAGIAMLLMYWFLESPMRRSAVTTGIWFGIQRRNEVSTNWSPGIVLHRVPGRREPEGEAAATNRRLAVLRSTVPCGAWARVGQ